MIFRQMMKVIGEAGIICIIAFSVGVAHKKQNLLLSEQTFPLRFSQV